MPKQNDSFIKPKASLDMIQRRTFEKYSTTNFDELAFFEEVSADELLRRIEPKTLPNIEAPLIAIDTETFAYTHINNNRMPPNVVRRWIKMHSRFIPNDFPFCISISDGKQGYTIYDSVENSFKEFKKLAPLLNDTGVAKVGHNLGFDLHMLANAGVNLKGRLYDTYHLSRLTRADAFTHNLFDISRDLDGTVTVFEQMLNSYKSDYRITDYRQFPKELMTQYAAADVWNTLIVLEELYPLLISNQQVELYDIECAIVFIAYKMEREGLLIDADYEDILIPELTAEMDAAERRIYETAGTVFNINSSAQVVGVLNDLGYGHLVRYNQPTDLMLSKGILQGNPKMDRSEKERLENEGVPLIADIMEFEKAQKLLNTFALKLYEMCDSENLVHCNINTSEAKTGRFSISSPSMQNMPRRKDSRVRDAFIAPDDYRLYEFDFKAQESIILVHYSRSQYLMDILHDGGDIHKAVATIIFSVPYDEVTRELREISKSVEFAIVYGAGPSKVATMTGLSFEEATVAMKTFLRNCPEIDMFIKTANNVARERRFIRTRMNRVAYVERGREYACVNYCIQGSAADSTKSKMVDIYTFLSANNYKSKMLLQVHDSLLNKIHVDEESFMPGYLKWLQTERDLFRVPVLVDVTKCYPTWRNKEELDIPAVRPPEEQLLRAAEHNIWKEGIL